MKRLLVLAVAWFGVSAAYAGGQALPDYPFRVKEVRLHFYPPGDPGLGADAPEGVGYAALLDRNGAVEALKFNFHDTGCFDHSKDLYFQLGGYYPARWVKPNQIELVTDFSKAGRAHECRFKVKRTAVPDTKDYWVVKALGPADMAKIYERTSVTNPPAHPLVRGNRPGSWIPAGSKPPVVLVGAAPAPRPNQAYDASGNVLSTPVATH